MAVVPAAEGPLAANIILSIFAILAVIARFVARQGKHVPLKADDWTIMGALVIAVACCMLQVYGCAAGLVGVDVPFLTPMQFFEVNKIIRASVVLNHFNFGLIKISVILFYKRLFATSVQTNKFKWAANISLALVAGFMISSFFTVMFSTNPFNASWTVPPQMLPQFIVLDMPNLITAFAALDMLLDILVLALPIPVISTLNMNKSKKIGLVGVFLLGAFCLVASIVRLYYVVQLLDNDMTEWKYLVDVNTMWANIEACASIVCACLPTLASLFATSRLLESILGSVRSMFSSRRGSTKEASGKYGNGHGGGHVGYGYSGNSMSKPLPSNSLESERLPIAHGSSDNGGSRGHQGTYVGRADPRDYDDLEAQKKRIHGIVVEKTFHADSYNRY